MLIHFNGMPGVGKLTIAKIVSERLGAHLVDNHSIINAVYAAGCEHGSPDFIAVHKKISDVIYTKLSGDKQIKDIIMTNAFIRDIPENTDRLNAIIDLATRRSEPFIPVLLSCDHDENIRRASTPSRAEKQKMTNTEKLRPFLDMGIKFNCPKTEFAQFELDVTNLTPEQSATAVIAHLTSLGLIP